ncbi:MAG: ion channel [Hyphomicrobiaceae bacterium]
MQDLTKASPAAGRTRRLRSRLRRLYFSAEPSARLFRMALLAIDVALLVYFVVASFHYKAGWHSTTDIVVASVLIFEWLVRLWIYDLRMTLFRQVSTWTDVLVILSLLAPILNESLLFLRVLRFMRLFHSYHVLRDLREVSSFFRKNEEVIDATINLAVFVFIMSAIVYVFQVRTNSGINHYVDALYFTVTTLTTTGYGDIVMKDEAGRLLAVAIMIFGLGLFLRLIQAIFRPATVRKECPDCGLVRHDADAVHCKHCGRVINIRNEGGE